MSRMESPDDRTTTASVPLSGARLERFEDYIEARDISKAEALRRGIDELTEDGVDDDRDGRAPPDDDELAKAYQALKRLAGGSGWVRRDRATTYLSQRIPDYDKQTVYGGLIRPLRERAYLETMSDAQGRSSAVFVRE